MMSTQPIRILHIFGDSAFGGACLSVSRLAEAEKAEGWSVEILTTNPEYAAYLTARGIGVQAIDSIWRRTRPIKDVVGLVSLYRFLRAGNYTIVHTHTSKAGLIGRIAAYCAEIPIILHSVHGFAFHENSHAIVVWLFSWVERLAARCCRFLVVVSHFHADWAVKLRIAPWSKIRCIPNGVPAHVSSPGARESFRRSAGLSGEELVVCYAGRLAPGKGLQEIIAAIPRVLKAGVGPMRFVFVGDGPLRRRLEALAAELRVHRYAVFLGFRCDLPEILDAVDICAFPSIREGLSISLLEAMAAGKPIIASAIGSNREATGDGDAAYLVPVGSSDRLADAMVELARNPGKRAELGSRARRIWEERYTLARMHRQYIDLYYEALSAKERIVCVSHSDHY